MQLLRHQRVEIFQAGSGSAATLAVTPSPLSRAQRAHARLSWGDRLARNTAPSTPSSVSIRLFGIPDAFAEAIGLKTAGKTEISG